MGTLYVLVKMIKGTNIGIARTQKLGSKVDKPSKILIKISNAIEYIESDIQNTEASRRDDPII